MQNLGISYRRCRKKDMLPSVRLVLSSLDDIRVRTGKEPMDRRVRRVPGFFDHLLRTDRNTFYCTWHGARLVGFAGAIVRGKQWYLAWLFVHPRYQGRGIGSKLLEKVWRDRPIPPTLQHQPRRGDRSPVDCPPGLEGRLPLILADNFGRYLERLPGLDEPAVFDGSGLFEHHHAMGEVLARPNQPRPGLGHGLKHQDAGHHGKSGIMVGQVLFGHRQRLDRRDSRAGLQLVDAVNQ